MKMIGCTKRKCPFVNPGECHITAGCPYYTSETIEKAEKTVAGIVNRIVQDLTRYHAIDTLQEIKNRISEMQTYKLFSDDDEKYISRDEVLKLIDEKIKECSE
jgi:hypothetical protein